MKESAASRPEIKEFIQFTMKEGAALVKEVGFVPLPASSYQLALKHFNERKLGSVLGGVPKVGVTIEQLLAMEAKL